MQEFRWVTLFGEFFFPKPVGSSNSFTFKGGEFDAQIPIEDEQSSVPEKRDTQPPPAPVPKSAISGKIISNRYFKEGRITAEIEFSQNSDTRSFADIIIQFDPNTDDMLCASLGGFGNARVPPLISLRLWTRPLKDPSLNEPQTGVAPNQSWQYLRTAGLRIGLQPGQPYEMEVIVLGSSVKVLLNGVVMLQHFLQFPLPRHQVGFFCAGAKDIRFRKIAVESMPPKAFVVMQYNTPAYEHVFEHVIKPVCDDEEIGLTAYRADYTHMPGLVIEDIQRQIQESLVVIAEITPINASVYYEVGYADALQKPVVLIADYSVKQLPFDVRMSRTIFYENSIGGKEALQQTLKKYLKNIVANKI